VTEARSGVYRLYEIDVIDVSDRRLGYPKALFINHLGLLYNQRAVFSTVSMSARPIRPAFTCDIL